MPVFSGEIFPINIALQWEGGPAFDNYIATSGAGIEWRTQVSELPRYEYDVSHSGMTAAKRKKLTAFFLTHGAQAMSFRFFDHLDYEVLAGEGTLTAIPDSPEGDWQLYKKYTSGSLTFYRRITKPISPIVVTGGSGHSVDYDTGVVTCTGTPTAWTGRFHVHARFNIRQMRAAVQTKNAAQGFIVTWPSIPIVEVKKEIDGDD